ncbi:MAG: phospho-N-acetylmuramoyl-pentapeptide-transferase [Eubacteriaceae bacterium]|nr:phospho-N-acetylmuramoyl-pentapeptide-transferase [Eubacteriaceae bacterium]
MTLLKQGMIAFLIAFVAVWIGTKYFLPVLKKWHFGQSIREEGPQSHMKKSGTPTMGGLVIQAGVLVSTLIVALVTHSHFLFPLVVMVVFGTIGFIDDYISIAKKHNLGLKAWQKLVLQFVAALAIALYAGTHPQIGTQLIIPFTHQSVDLGFWYYPLTFFAIVAVTNAVNLTDGLDGLASGVTAFVMFFFTAAAMLSQNTESVIFGAAVIGACFGFLRYNSNPANVFMGDTGSMALGGAVIGIAIMLKMELFVLIAGIVYVAEAGSVLLQVAYFKATGGKRLFRMSPIHHHFELKGWPETRVVTVFWIVTLFWVAVAFLAL